MPQEAEHRLLAEELRRAERERRGLPLFTDRVPDFTWADARGVARARDDLRHDDGDVLLGYKLGWTSPAMREALGIDQPNWGTLWRSQVVDHVLDTSGLIHPKMEPELVYVAASDIAGDVDHERVVASCAGWAAGLEIVDPRFESYDFRWLDNTADNSSAARVAISAVVASDADPAHWKLEFSDDETTHRGEGSQAMGSPVEAVVWLVRSLAAEGSGLRAGEVVFTGGITAPFDVVPGRTYRAEVVDIGAAVEVASY